jgi:diaminopimelate epimerase
VIHEKLILAAGGNGVAVRILNDSLTRSQYETIGKGLVDRFEESGAEQVGFLVLNDQHFEMAGGEFCGNASRAAALLFAQSHDVDDVSFTVSGFDGLVKARVEKTDAGQFNVHCSFIGMRFDVREVILPDDTPAAIVDLGGIVHVVIEAPFPADRLAYEREHNLLTKTFDLGERDAVGVVWFERIADTITMHPVVWVRAINTFIYETSCGSGAIAVGGVTNIPSIIQPSGQMIMAEINENSIILASEMEVVH